MVDELGGFGAFFEIPSHYQQPLLVSGTDGVGTKLKLAHALNQHHTIGIDLVAMCVNDIICHGAEPLFFLDYYATGELDVDQSTAIIQGIGKGCQLAGAALIGGETAEMPGMYQGSDYDLAGFCLGVVEKDQVIDGREVTVGDAIIALASSGAHSNGYSLIRKVVEHCGADYEQAFNNSTLGEALLAPTRLYAHTIQQLLKPSMCMVSLTLPAAAYLKMSPAACQPIPARHLIEIAGIFPIFSNGCKRKATSLTMKCIVALMSALAW